MVDRVGRHRAGAAARHAWLATVAAAIVLAAAACNDAAAPVKLPPPCTGLSIICTVPLHTYDGSGQIVHPDVAVFPDGFGGHDFWLAVTPYPNGNANFENPSLYTDGSDRWIPAPGVSNPLVGAPQSPAHNSDPDLVYDSDAQRLRLYYRLTQGGADDIRMRTSSDGSHWTNSVSVVSAPGIAIVSPAVARTPNGTWTMWSVNAVNGGCLARSTVLERRTSPDGVRWSPPAPLAVSQPGYVLWHIDVQYIPSKSEYWALIAAYPVGSGCAADDLFFARSTDGVTWQTYPTPIVARTDYAAYASAVYRSTFYYDAGNDALRLWLSGAVHENGSWVWTMATSRWRLADLMAHISASSAPVAGGTPTAGRPAAWNTTSPDAARSDFP